MKPDTIKLELVKELREQTHYSVCYLLAEQVMGEEGTEKHYYTLSLGEKDGVDYHFMPVSGFTREVLNGNMLEATEYNDWFYGTDINALTPNKINIGIFSPAAVEALLQDSRLDVDVVRVVTANKTRLKRALNREDVPDCAEICRRYLADEKDFADLDFDYWIVENYEGTRLECLDLFYCSNSLDFLSNILNDL